MRSSIGRQLRHLGRRLFPDMSDFSLERRNEALRRDLRSIGSPVRIRHPVGLYPPSRVSIGSNVVIHEHSYLDASGGITIGDNVAISLGCTILTFNHLY